MAPRKRTKCDLDLSDFSAVGSLFAPHARRHYGTCASFCLRENRPRGAIVLEVRTDSGVTQLSVGVLKITKAIRATLGDNDDAAEHGAYGMALLAAAHAIGVRFLRRSFKGPGFDFFVTPPGAGRGDDDDIFGDQWGFEVSGIFKGDGSRVRTRLRKKEKQVAEAVKLHPVMVAVVEFSKPVAVFKLKASA